MLLSACAGASGRAATADRTIERLLDRTCLPFVSGRASEAEAVRAGGLRRLHLPPDPISPRAPGRYYASGVAGIGDIDLSDDRPGRSCAFQVRAADPSIVVDAARRVASAHPDLLQPASARNGHIVFCEAPGRAVALVISDAAAASRFREVDVQALGHLGGRPPCAASKGYP